MTDSTIPSIVDTDKESGRCSRRFSISDVSESFVPECVDSSSSPPDRAQLPPQQTTLGTVSEVTRESVSGDNTAETLSSRRPATDGVSTSTECEENKEDASTPNNKLTASSSVEKEEQSGNEQQEEETTENHNGDPLPSFKAQTSEFTISSQGSPSSASTTTNDRAKMKSRRPLPNFKAQTSSFVAGSVDTTDHPSSPSAEEGCIQLFERTPQQGVVVVSSTNGIVVTDNSLLAEAQAVLVPVEALPESKLSSATESKGRGATRGLLYFVASLLAMVLLAGIVVGAVCATGHCKGRDPSDTTTSTPPARPFSPPDPARVETLQALVERISLGGVSYPPARATPQEMALQWLLEEDPMQVQVGSMSVEQITQRYVLAVLAYSTQITDLWLLPNDNNGYHECTWEGVRGCIDGIVTQLHGPTTVAMQGTLPSELAALTDIAVFSVPNNALTGPIPPELGTAWRSLEEFNVSGNQLTGPLPAKWSPTLRIFNGAENAFTGTLPLDMARLSNIEHFWVSENNLSGSIPEAFQNWQYLQSFLAFQNRLTSTIPTALATAWTSLKSLEVNNNLLSGPIPDFVGASSSSVESLFVYGNQQLTGVIDCTAETTTNIVADCNGFVSCSCCSLCCPGPAWC